MSLDQVIEWFERMQLISTLLCVIVFSIGSALYGLRWFIKMFLFCIVLGSFLMFILIPNL